MLFGACPILKVGNNETGFKAVNKNSTKHFDANGNKFAPFKHGFKELGNFCLIFQKGQLKRL